MNDKLPIDLPPSGPTNRGQAVARAWIQISRESLGVCPLGRLAWRSEEAWLDHNAGFHSLCQMEWEFRQE